MINLNKNKTFYYKRRRKIQKQQQNWKVERQNIQRENNIKNDFNKINNKNPFKITTSKKAMWFLFILCTLIILFTAWITLKEFQLAMQYNITPDFTPLVAMIGAVIGATIDVSAYFAKSAKENIKGGITFQAAAANNFIENPIPQGDSYQEEDFLSIDDLIEDEEE